MGRTEDNDPMKNMHRNESKGKDQEKGHIGIIGSGVIGLTCALVLSEAGYKVSILAREIPGDETSDQSKDWASPWFVSLLWFPRPFVVWKLWTV